MGKNKFWVVAKGYQTGIFNNHEEARKSYSKYYGAKHGGFKTFEEAEEFLRNNSQPVQQPPTSNAPMTQTSTSLSSPSSSQSSVSSVAGTIANVPSTPLTPTSGNSSAQSSQEGMLSGAFGQGQAMDYLILDSSQERLGLSTPGRAAPKEVCPTGKRERRPSASEPNGSARKLAKLGRPQLDASSPNIPRLCDPFRSSDSSDTPKGQIKVYPAIDHFGEDEAETAGHSPGTDREHCANAWTVTLQFGSKVTLGHYPNLEEDFIAEESGTVVKFEKTSLKALLEMTKDKPDYQIARLVDFARQPNVEWWPLVQFAKGPPRVIRANCLVVGNTAGESTRARSRCYLPLVVVEDDKRPQVEAASSQESAL